MNDALKEYTCLLNRKRQEGALHGFDPIFMGGGLFDFQRAVVEWAVRKGRCAIFGDCGLGKTPMQLTWAENIVRKTGGRVLILAPLAVSYQTVKESEKFNIEARRSGDGSLPANIIVTNYEKLHLFSPDDFRGVVCDESSILKNFGGARRKEITNFMRKMPYRLLATATAAPNDYIELGTSSEALGELGFTDMLNRFFKNEQNNSAMRRLYGKAMTWRFKGHAHEVFWRWVSSWARAFRRPSDLGFDDDGFILPTLTENEHTVSARTIMDGFLFSLPAVGIWEQREERRRTINERCEKVAQLVCAHPERQSLVWCHLNNEGDLLERLIPDAVQISGADSDDKKEAALLAFANGDIRALITKPKIGAWGLNLQNCHHVTFFPSHSFEQYYQGIRRCWRFGQKHPVSVDIVTTEGERDVLANLQRKAKAADAMFSSLVAEMNNSMAIRVGDYGTKNEEVPEWLSSIS